MQDFGFVEQKVQTRQYHLGPGNISLGAAQPRGRVREGHQTARNEVKSGDRRTIWGLISSARWPEAP
jgi:DNA-binding IclR family transcriptional regulator